MNAALQRLRVRVAGRVQGVGFRPAVYRLAAILGLTGWVRNTAEGVLLEVQGSPAALATLLERLRARPPPQARIASVDTEVLPVAEGEHAFAVAPSARSGDVRTGMPPDLALCPACAAEMADPANRRHGHAFISCTDCGPRFSIIRALPYDRERTTMDVFPMCPACRAEFENPADRRFEAQPIACRDCGPRVRLVAVDRPGAPAAPDGAVAAAALAEAVRRLAAGQILAVKGIGGYHLCCDACSDAAVALLRARKCRPHKALAVMVADLEAARRCCRVGDPEAALLASPAAPIVILPRQAGAPLSALVAPDTADVGLLLPYAPLHRLLLAQTGPLVMTSGNRADEPIARDEPGLAALLGPVADAALVHDRAIARRCDDSVLKVVDARPLMLRRSRGYVPEAVRLPFGGPPVLACGAQVKNTVCLTRGAEAFLSPHIGDLDDPRAVQAFEEAIADVAQLLEVRPAILAHDLHPDYTATRYARRRAPAACLAVQHHHAHIAAGMAEHGLDGTVLGVALDGTGCGPDGTIWGGEFLVADYAAFRRAGHFKAYRMPGGEAAIREPSRMAFSLLGAELEDADRMPWPDLLPDLPDEARRTCVAMLEQGLNAPWTTSAGRLFDAVAALLGFGAPVTYEAQAAVRLQTLACTARPAPAWPAAIEDRGGAFEVSFGPAVRALIAARRAGTDRAVLAAQFHATVAEAIGAACARLRERERLDRVVLSGGVFQNDLLLGLAIKTLNQRGFQVYAPSQVPPNDGGIALGQAAVALARRRAAGRGPPPAGAAGR